MSIQRTGGLSFNRACYEALGQPKAVELLYDRASEIIGVRPADPDAPDSYLVQAPHAKRDSGFIVSGKAFTAYYDIPTDTPRRWFAYMADEVLCVDLNSPSVEVVSGRPRRHPLEVSGPVS